MLTDAVIVPSVQWQVCLLCRIYDLEQPVPFQPWPTTDSARSVTLHSASPELFVDKEPGIDFPSRGSFPAVLSFRVHLRALTPFRFRGA